MRRMGSRLRVAVGRPGRRACRRPSPQPCGCLPGRWTGLRWCLWPGSFLHQSWVQATRKWVRVSVGILLLTMQDNTGRLVFMASNLPDPEPGYYEGKFDGQIYEVRVSKAGKWYAMRMGR